MKRTKLLLGVGTLALALLGTGYAAMTDTLTIGGKVDTANFCVQFQGPVEAVSAAAINPTEYELSEDTGAKLANGDNHVIEFKAGNLKPGVPLKYQAKIQNFSSIKANFEGVFFELPKNKPEIKTLADQVHIKITVTSDNKNNSMYEFEGPLSTLITRTPANMVLEPKDDGSTDDEALLEFTIEWKPDNQNNTIQQSAVEFKTHLVWSQTMSPENAEQPQNQ